jgi:hypothetical protein
MEEMSLLSFTRSLNSTLPIRQHSLQRPFGMLQGRNVVGWRGELATVCREALEDSQASG